MIQLTPREALAIQAKQIAHYAPQCPSINLALVVTGLTSTEGLDLDTMYSVVEINRHIPRGAAIEAIMHKATKVQS